MSNAREVKRSEIALRAAIEARHAAEAELASAKKTLTARIKELEAELWRVNETGRQDRLMRLAAQRGLVRYMRENGKADQIGYDPDRDPDVIAAIGAGTLPKPGLALERLIEPESRAELGVVLSPAPPNTTSRTVA